MTQCYPTRVVSTAVWLLTLGPVAAVTLPGCATLKLGSYEWNEEIVSRQPHEVHHAALKSTTTQQDAELRIAVTPLCNEVEHQTVQRTGVADYENDTPGSDWAWGILGLLTTGAGGFADSRH